MAQANPGPGGLQLVSAADVQYVDSLYDEYKTNPEKLDETWVYFFKGLEFGIESGGDSGLSSGSSTGPSTGVAPSSELDREFRIFRLIQSYRARGHLLSTTNPIRPRKNRMPHLELIDYGLTQEDLNKETVCGEYIGLGRVTLKTIIDHMERVYCKNIGVEYMHITDTEVRRWFRDRFEKDSGRYNFSVNKKTQILHKLNQAVVFENFLNTKYIGQKRFSLEGGENTIPALDAIINKAIEHNVEEVVVGMAHRGRLNVLANILGKTYEYIFNEFEGQAAPELSFGDGDVKYHLGFASELKRPNGESTYLKLMPNPSHLEAVNPVVMGYCRAQSDILYEENSSRVLPILIHGDAAVAGQGIVYECSQMEKLKGYQVGGTVHFVINNQIGFTTDFDDARSSTYSTSVARVINAPVIHVNGDDAEAVVYAAELATEFRQKFRKDIYVDMVCYRRHGHNEGDEPKYTQPSLYKLISKHPSPRDIYVKNLESSGEIGADIAKSMEKEFKELLQDRLNMAKEKPQPFKHQAPDKEWFKLERSKPEDFEASYKTGVKEKDLEEILKTLNTIPADINPIKKTVKIHGDRQKRWENNQLDWAMGELLAYGSLLKEGIAVRMSGQDCIRGTFSHRHALTFDESGNKSYNHLNHISKDQAPFRIYNSFLSEYAVLGYEFGYSLGRPSDINIWEAQFGDFANGAQTVIDQFISSGESKWGKNSGLVVYLPHGYEGQGPEHSNARPERYLQLAAEMNMVIVNCTNPANLFHALRRHVTWNFRKPLIVFTPKSLLRHPECVSSKADLIQGEFHPVIHDQDIDAKNVKRVVLCSGKVYFDLLAKKRELGRKDIAVIRLEQLYPMPEQTINKINKDFAKAEKVWVQEEPKNMGAWTYLLRFDQFRDYKLISRKASASPATGFPSVHKEEQERIVNLALG